MTALEPIVLGLGKPKTESANDACQQLLEHIQLLKKVEQAHLEVSTTSIAGNSIMLFILEADPTSNFLPHLINPIVNFICFQNGPMFIIRTLQLFYPPAKMQFQQVSQQI